MTNGEIILHERFKLLMDGVIESTGQTISIIRDDGTTEDMPEPEYIHTYAGWRQLGYTVRKGEHAIAAFPIWKHCPAGERCNRKTGQMVHCDERMIMTQAYFFSRSQCEPVTMDREEAVNGDVKEG